MAGFRRQMLHYAAADKGNCRACFAGFGDGKKHDMLTAKAPLLPQCRSLKPFALS